MQIDLVGPPLFGANGRRGQGLSTPVRPGKDPLRAAEAFPPGENRACPQLCNSCSARCNLIIYAGRRVSARHRPMQHVPRNFNQNACLHARSQGCSRAGCAIERHRIGPLEISGSEPACSTMRYPARPSSRQGT